MHEGDVVRSWWVKLLNKLGIYTRSQMDQLSTSLMYANKQLDKVSAELRDSLIIRDKRSSELARVEGENKTLLSIVDKLESEMDGYKEAASTNLDLIKELQKQVGDLFHDHPMFGFPHSVPIPGSTCVTTSGYVKEDGKDMVILRGRSILTDDMTSAIDGTPGIPERTTLIRNYMERYGILERIAKDLFNRGAIKLTLAYNRNCTAYEVYYEAAVDHASKTAVITIDKSAGGDSDDIPTI